MDNMHNREAELDALAVRGKQVIAACAASKATIFDNILEYGKVLFEGRKKFISNNDFHDWVVRNGLDAPPFADSAERSNAQKLATVLGSVPKTAFADCPYTTPSNIMKWARQNGIVEIKSSSRPKKGEPNPLETTAEAIKAATGEWPTSRELADETGIHPRSAETVLRVVKAKEEVRDLPPVKFTKADEKHIEARIKAHQAQLDAAFVDIVNAKINDLLENTIAPQYRKQLAEAEAVIKARRGVMRRETFKLILACLHPDNSASAERRSEAFRQFSELELVLVAEKEAPYTARVTDVPRSRAEWEARRAEVAAKRKAVRG